MTIQDLTRRIRYMLGPFLWLLLTFYFGYHALNGKRGLFRMFELKQEIKVATQVSEEIANRRKDMETKVQQLSPQSLDLDILEESARTILNMGKEGDYIILDNSE